MNIPNVEFPDEIIMDILSRLPVRSLLQFRCVSKRFRGLISDNHFIKSHLKKAESLSTHHRILIPTSPLLSLNYNNNIYESMELNFPFLKPSRLVKIMGSCNGLVCLIDGYTRDMIIYNPSTRRHFNPFPLSQQVVRCSNEPNRIEYVYGFGCGSNPNDIRLVRFPRFARDSENIKFKVYDFIDTSATFLNGSLHWLARHANNENENRVIASFNVTKETFTDLSLPRQIPNLPYYNLGVLKGSLYAIRDVIDHKKIEVWLLNDYGVINSWLKFIIIPLDVGTGGIPYMRPLTCVSDHEILLEIALQSYAIYNAKNKTFRFIRSDLDCYGDAAIYVESLLSPQVSCVLY